MRISDWSSDVCSSDLPLLHRRRVEEAKRGGAVAQHQAVPDHRHAPALAFVIEGAHRFHILDRPAIADAAPPGDTDDLVAPARNPFAELVGRKFRLGERFSGREVEPGDARLAVLAGGFVEMPLVPE